MGGVATVITRLRCFRQSWTRMTMAASGEDKTSRIGEMYNRTRDLFRPMTATTMKSIFILTGAGISAESGIQVFRGPDGLWEGYMLE